jgi:hypothetical protein
MGTTMRPVVVEKVIVAGSVAVGCAGALDG